MVPWRGDNTADYIGTYDKSKVRIAGWEYSSNGRDLVFTFNMPTHAVLWMRPKFEEID